MKTTLAKIAAADSSQVQHLRQHIRVLEKERKKLSERLGSQEEFAALCSASVAASDPFPRFHYQRKAKVTSPVTAVLNFSDWHIGERINRREIEGYNHYNWAIAQQRAFSITTDFLKWVDVQRSVYSINECVVCGLGDYVSGDIHGELLATNEFPLPEQSVNAGLLLGECIRRLAAHFKTLRIAAVGADNHGRIQKKPQAKQKTSNNMSFVVHAIAEKTTAGLPNVSWNIAKGIKLLVEINGWRFLCEHGDQIRGNMGIPYYGFQRLVGKEAVRRMGTNKGFHFLNIGHFHVPAIIENRTLVNGSLSGTSEFDASQGRHAAPSQVAFMVSPKHGVFNWTAFRC